MPESHQPTPFGQPVSTPSAFGQPNTFQQANTGPGFAASPFGQTNHSQQAAPFGQPAIAAPVANLSPFGQQPSTAPFGFGSQPQNQPLFGQPQTSQTQSSQQQPSQREASTFGQPSPFAQAPAAQPFGQPPTNTFGTSNSNQAPHVTDGGFGSQSSFQGGTPFGQAQPQQSGSLPFGAAPITTSEIGQLSGSTNKATIPPQTNSFGVNSGVGFGAQGNTSNAFGNGVNHASANQSTPLTNGASTATFEPLPPADVRTYTTRDASNRLMTWHGNPVTYSQTGQPCIRVSGGLERVWFPDGAPTASANNNDPSLQYTPELKAAYGYLNHNGTFKDGIMPEIAPQPEWCRWDV